MVTALIAHQACLGHVTPDGHPERAARLDAVWRALKTEEFQSLIWIDAPEASRDELELAHSPGLVGLVLDEAAAAATRGFVGIDSDTVMSAGSAKAALRAAGAAIRAVDGVIAGEFANAFCAVRPPGHHAERDRAMGFCLFNNVAVGALHARKAHKLKRIAAIDFDVHHGNGTQDIFHDDPDLFYASTHQHPLYPGTGRISERGIAGNILNVPLPPGADGEALRAALSDAILPALRSFSPDLIFISAGFDGHRADPLAEMFLDEGDFHWATAAICRVAADCCGGRVVSALEGGYDLAALARSARAHVRALMEA
ncbi:MAG TPA: histone deacetylase family protein [Rhizomicrobium sp.]|nr:histone deacetylase family protein [Rhizomicrobium sp.]